MTTNKDMIVVDKKTTESMEVELDLEQLKIHDHGSVLMGVALRSNRITFFTSVHYYGFRKDLRGVQ